MTKNSSIIRLRNMEFTFRTYKNQNMVENIKLSQRYVNIRLEKTNASAICANLIEKLESNTISFNKSLRL